MLDGINAFLDAYGLIFKAVFNAPLFGSLTWGYFIISVAIIGIMLSFFIARFK